MTDTPTPQEAAQDLALPGIEGWEIEQALRDSGMLAAVKRVLKTRSLSTISLASSVQTGMTDGPSLKHGPSMKQMVDQKGSMNAPSNYWTKMKTTGGTGSWF